MKANIIFTTMLNILSHVFMCFTSKRLLSDSLQLLTILSFAKKAYFLPPACFGYWKPNEILCHLCAKSTCPRRTPPEDES